MFCSSCGGIKPYRSRCHLGNVSTPINSMLRSFSFSPSSALQIQRDVENDMRRFDWEISQLRSRLLYLEEQQDLLTKHDEELKSLSAPIRRLPVELLTRIFLAVCDGHPITFAARVESIGHLPFTLASVCGSGWRQIVIDIPRLWSNLEIPYETDPSIHSRLEKPLRLCLVRSKSHALSVGLWDGEKSPLVRQLVEESARWQHATIADLLEVEFPSLASGKSFPLLETLETRHYAEEDLDQHTFGDPHLFLFRSAPRLHSLKTTKLPPPDELRAFTPRNQITNLEIICRTSIYNFEGFIYQRELHNFPNLKSWFLQN
ncbi:hypothetical protein D9758_006615 [Tetrapyrgos nigripes]|uniref:F-box domain-containing protein n=1 Tax=Tetrapyrgos nigripes TaxID=182062 RepID=A0A8H5GJC6_9AGAR|nr:hypothetical protein D9758_006615 [Tetrapyrgos nigripes]